jgi:predicted DNA-binding transcriptional regulator AlpA
MCYNDLKAEMIRKGLSIPKVADVLGLSKKTLYQKMHGKTQFKQKEMGALRDILSLSEEQMRELFF